MHFFVADETGQPGFADRLAKRFEFFAQPFGDEFDAAVIQVTHNAGDFKSGGDVFGGVTEAHALHAA